MRKFTFCVTAALTALALLPGSVANAEVSKQVNLSIAKDKSSETTVVTLQKGTYNFTGEKTTIEVDGNVANATNYVIASAKDVQIKWKLESAATEAISNKVTISTESDKDAKDDFTAKLAIQSNQAGSYDDTKLQELALETSKLQGTVNKLTWDQYQEYAETGTVVELQTAIEDLGAKIADAVANFEAYETAKTIHGDLETELATLTDTYNSAADAIKTISKDLYNGLKAEVASFKSDAKTAYEAYEVTSASKESYEKNLADNANLTKASIAQAIKAITKGTTNEFSNANVVVAIGDARSEYNDYANDLFILMQLTGDDADIYSDIYVAALTDMGATLREINKVEEENANLYEAEGCDDQSQADFIDRLSDAIAPLADIYDEYALLVNTLRDNYANACDDIDDIKALVKTQIENVYGNNRATVKDFYKDALAAINSSIAALQEDVDAANADHSIEGVAPYCDGYDEAKDEIIDAISALNVKVVATVAEYDANKNSLKQISDLQSYFDGKKSAVSALKSTDKKYESKNFFAATETSIQSSIDKVKADAQKAYTLTDDVNVVTAQNFNAALDLSAIEDAIDGYKDDADAALDKYNNVAAALADFAANMKTLKETATNTNVTVDGSLNPEVKSYGDTIAILEAAIAKTQSALDAALGKKDAAHVTAIKAIDPQATKINDELVALNTNYAVNEATWNENQLLAAKTRMLDDADRRIGDMVLPADYTADKYGLKTGDLNTKLNGYKDDLADLSDDVDDARSAEAAEAIALLAEVQDALDALDKKLSDLATEAANVKKAYDAEKKAKADIDKILELYTAKLNGGTVSGKDYPGVAASYTGARINFTDEITEQQGIITGITTDLATSFAAETVVKDLEDVKNDQGVVTKEGFTTRTDKLKAAIDQLLTYAANETANDKANADFNTAKTNANVDALISQAETDINSVATGDGKDFFIGELGKYQTEYNNIKAANVTAYGEVKDKYAGVAKYTNPAKNMTSTDGLGLTTRLAAVVTNINGLKALADANEKAHNAQVTALGKANDAWNNVFAEVTGSETSSVHDSIITDLTKYKKELAAHEAKIADEFKKGNSDKNKIAIEGELTAISNSIKTISDGWDDLYAAAIAHDNQVRKEAFDAVYDSLRATYTASITLIDKMQKLGFAKDANLGTTAVDLNGYAQTIRELDDAVEAEYTATVAPDLFDVDEENVDIAEQYITEILDLTETYTNQVNAAAAAAYADALADAQDAVADAKDALQDVLDYSAEEAAAAVEKVQAHIDAAEAVKDEQDFAYTLDKTILPYFTDTLYTDLSDIADAEANKVWDAKAKTANKLANAERHAIEKFANAEGKVGTRSEEYADYVKNTITKSVDQWKQSKTFGNYATAYGMGLNTFESEQYEKHTPVYWTAYNEDKAYFANDDSYEELTAAIEAASADYVAAKAFAESLYAKNNIAITDALEDIEVALAAIAEDVEEWWENKEADDNLATGKATIDDINDDIAAVYDLAIDKEKDAVDVAILALNYDYDKATAADLDDESIDKYLTLISDYSKENAKIYEDYDGKKKTAAETQTAYLALEKKIGVSKSELVAIWNAAEIQEIKTGYETAIAEINADYAALTAQLADCHDPVKAEYSEDVEAIKAAADAAKARFDKMAADNTLTLYADNIEADIQAIKDSYEDLSDFIADDEAPYDVNDARYPILKAKNEEYQTKLNDLVTLSKTFKYKDPSFDNNKKGIQKNYIDANATWLNNKNKNVQLTANSNLPNDPTNLFVQYEANLKWYDARQTLINELLSGASEYSNIEKFIGANVYDDGVEEALRDDIDAIAAVASKALYFVNNLYSDNSESNITKEIDGSNVKGGSRTTTLLDEYNGILAAIASIRDQYAAVNTEAAKDAKGDISGDEKIDFEDISGIIGIAMSDSQSAEDIKVADLNGDGVVDIADVVMLVNVYVYGNKYGAAGAPYAPAPFRNVNVDETISLSLTDNGVSVAFNNAYTYSALQMDVTLPAGASIKSFTAGERAQNHEIVANQLSNGAWRIIMFSAAGNSISLKSGELFSMAIESEGGMINIDNIKAARTSGAVKLISSKGMEIPGTTIVADVDAESQNADIFSTNGIQMDQMGNGVNIIRTESGAVKKIIVK